MGRLGVGENIDDVTDDIISTIYKNFGSDSGYLLGIEPQHRKAVRAIVNITLKSFIGMMESNEKGDQK